MARRTAKDILESKKIRENSLTWEQKKPEINSANKMQEFDVSNIKINTENLKINKSTPSKIAFLNSSAIISDEEIEKLKQSNAFKCILENV